MARKFSQPLLSRPFRLKVVEFGVTFYLVHASDHIDIVSVEFNILFLLFIKVKGVVLLHW